MDEKQFDTLFKDKLSNYSSSVPDSMWNRIEQKRRRRFMGGFAWKSSTLLMMGTWLLLAGTFTYALWPDNTLYGTNTVTDTTFVVDEPATIDYYSGTYIPPANNRPMAGTASAKPVVAKDNSNLRLPQALHPPIAPNTRNEAIIRKQQPQPGITAGSNAPTADVAGKTALPVWANATTNNMALTQPVKHNTAAFAKNRFKKPLAANELTAPNAELNLSQTDDLPACQPLFVPGSLVGIKANSLGLLSSNRQLKQTAYNNINIDKCPSVNPEGRNDWYLELYASPDYTFKSVQGGTASAAYLQRKDSAESMRGGFTFGARVTKSLSEHLMIKAGLQFSQINERLSLRSENETRTVTVITIRTITDNNGNTSTVTDTSRIVQVGYGVKTSYNYYRNIELPVMVGYEWSGEKLTTSINAGLIANLSSWYEGNTLAQNNELVSVKGTGNNGVYKTTVGMSLYGSVMFIKPWTDRLDIFAEPYLRYNLSNMGTSNLGFSQKFGAAGLSVGIRYRFNNGGQHL
jgi:hypothetical protein